MRNAFFDEIRLFPENVEDLESPDLVFFIQKSELVQQPSCSRNRGS